MKSDKPKYVDPKVRRITGKTLVPNPCLFSKSSKKTKSYNLPSKKAKKRGGGCEGFLLSVVLARAMLLKISAADPKIGHLIDIYFPCEKALARIPATKWRTTPLVSRKNPARGNWSLYARRLLGPARLGPTRQGLCPARLKALRPLA